MVAVKGYDLRGITVEDMAVPVEAPVITPKKKLDALMISTGEMILALPSNSELLVAFKKHLSMLGYPFEEFEKDFKEVSYKRVVAEASALKSQHRTLHHKIKVIENYGGIV
ncbi:MAG TPA: hypothetical protein VFM18_07140, partial [Methanosarcina sp.]|nr:hypothetical protein [Methanosarcina sp.]